MYQLLRTPGYEQALRDLEGDAGRLEAFLEKSVYWFLERNPRLGLPTLTPGYWVMRRRVIEGLLTIRVLYTFDEAARTVTLLSIQEVMMMNP